MVDTYRLASRAAEYLDASKGSPMAVVARVPDGTPLVLRDSSFLVYTRIPNCISPWLSAEQIAHLVAADAGLLPEALIDDVREFLKMLLLHGILEMKS